VSLSARTVLVTGGASGIGLATAQALVEEGTGVVLIDRDEERVTAAAAALRKRSPYVEAFGLDVTDVAAVRGLVEEIDERLPLYGVVNAAGVFQRGTILDVSHDDWDRVLDANLKSAYIVCKEVVPALTRRGRGAIVNLASISGRTKSIHTAPNYVASKAGIIGLTMAVAAQHARSGIRVNCVAPGVIDTPMTAGYSDAERAAIVATIPMARTGDPSEVASVIVALLSDGWSYVTGQTINVNGGLFMQ
jgi:NAD(P)-dependent dehydrogenase (short-subunit alcohol dehydrogenase family)